MGNVKIIVALRAILIRSNSPVQSTYILQSVEDIDRAIHTFKRNHLSRDTVESIKKMLV